VSEAGRPLRYGSELVCALQRRGRFLVGSPAFAARDADWRARNANAQLSIGPARALRGHALEDGDLALVRVERAAHASVIERIGSAEDAAAAIRALALDAGLGRPFDAAAEREAAELRRRPPGAVAHGARVDLRALPTFTIDPSDARDFDDAISATQLEGGGTLIWVHIADVAAYVRPGGAIDRAAQARACSVYLPGAVEPMLPEVLSADLCSLRPGVERPAISVELEVREGMVVRSSFKRSLIRSDARLEYEQVDRVLGGRERLEGPLAPALALAHRVACAMAGRRRERGALTLCSFEPEVRIDRAGAVTIAMRRSGGSPAHGRGEVDARGLIEQLMIAANEAVAGHLARARVPALYRVHEHPEPPRVELLRDQLASLELPTPPLAEVMTPADAGHALAEIARLTDGHLRALAGRSAGAPALAAGRTTAALQLALGALILRSLSQAFYSPRNIGHAALRSEAYCHFTSPIRRYPDLICHRALLASLAGAELPQAAGLADLGAWCSERERAAMALEREADAMARCFALEQALAGGERERPLQGVVVGVISAGAFVAFGLPENRALRPTAEADAPPFEGLLALRQLRAAQRSEAGPGRPAAAARKLRGAGVRAHYECNAQGTILHASGAGRSVRIGDPLAVRVGRIETLRGRVELLAVGDREDAERGRSMSSVPAGAPGARRAAGRRGAPRRRARAGGGR